MDIPEEDLDKNEYFHKHAKDLTVFFNHLIQGTNMDEDKITKACNKTGFDHIKVSKGWLALG